MGKVARLTNCTTGGPVFVDVQDGKIIRMTPIDLDKVTNQRFRFYCFPIRWYMGDGSMVRCVAEIDEEKVNKGVPDRTYTYCGTGYGPASGY